MKSNGWKFEVETPESMPSFESYVGLLYDENRGHQVLRLPIGYAKAPVDNPHLCLGEISRVVAHFCTLFADSPPSEYKRDGYLEDDQGLRIIPEESTTPGLSRIYACVQLMRQLGDPRLLTTVRAPGLAALFDARHISRSLAHAYYLDDGTPVFDHMWTQSSQLRRTSTDLVGMAAWAALDALVHLFPDIADTALSSSLRAEWEVLADRFVNDFGLGGVASLFTDTSGQTLALLQEALET